VSVRVFPQTACGIAIEEEDLTWGCHCSVGWGLRALNVLALAAGH
jgi:hypothetical protein